MIGTGLASCAILRDFDVTLYDLDPDMESKVKASLDRIYGILIDAGVTTKAEVDEKIGRVRFTHDLKEAVDGADFIQESISERLELKQSVYRQIQEITGEETIICSSTSQLFPSALSEGALYPGSILCGHPYNPSYLLPLIEICGGPTGSQSAIDKAIKIYEAMGKAPVVCKKETTGFIVNKLSWAAMDAAKAAVADGVCSVDDMDKAIIYGPGLRMAVTGQILTLSLGIQGGFREAAAKYGKEPDPVDIILADGIDEALPKRPKEKGQTVEEIEIWRDKMFAEILKLHGML